MPKTLDPQPTERAVSKRDADEVYREITEMIRGAFGAPRRWTADDLEAMLPRAAFVLGEAVQGEAISEEEAVEALRAFTATLFELRASEQVDSALSGIKFPVSRPSFQGFAFHDRRGSAKE
jgi:hypothetical protein